jgi:hypothetical protein
MLRTIPLLGITATLTFLSGYVHGLWTDRWGDSPELQEAVARLERVPTKVGDWDGHEEQLDPRATRRAGFRGYVTRRYENRRTGATVHLLLACGRSGPLSVHTPEVCYRGSGYAQVGRLRKHAPTPAESSAPAEFWTARFSKGAAAAPPQLAVLWAWSAGRGWLAPDNPRLTFAGAPALYKLYVVNATSPAEGSGVDGTCQEFLRQLLPELDKAIFRRP